MCRSIEKVVKKKLCLQCGMCYSVCPVNAISLDVIKDGYPIVNSQKCTKCEACLKVCSGMFPDYYSVSSRSKLGEIRSSYVGYSNNSGVRQKAASGGIATSISSYLLSSGEVDAMILVRGDKKYPLRNEIIFAQNEADVLSAMGSRYAPAFVCSKFKEIDTEKRYGLIGKPCDIYAVKKLGRFKKEYENAIKYTIGIFCHHTPPYSATDQIIHSLSIREDYISGIQYRGDGWPGDFAVFDKNGKTIFRDKYLKIWNKYLSITNNRCGFCCDCTAEHADISLGDPWLKKYENFGVGQNLIVTRTLKGDDLINKMISQKQITSVLISKAEVIASQKYLLQKKQWVAYRIIKSKMIGKSVPEVSVNIFTLFKAACHIFNKLSLALCL